MAQPPATLPPKLRLQQLDDGSTVLVTAVPIAAGSIVIDEQPLLHVPQLRPSHPAFRPLQQYFEKTQIPPSVVLKVREAVGTG